ncbi:MAG: PAS domain S-box protein [Bacteroidota bacterium]
MSAPLRLLFVAAPPDAISALRTARSGGPVEAQLAPSAHVLRASFDEQDWDAVVVVPGGPVEEVEVAVYVPDGVPLFIVAADVPLLLSETAAQAISMDDLAHIHERLSPPADAPAELASHPAEETPPAEPPTPRRPAPDRHPDPDPPGRLDRAHLASLADHLPIGLYRSDVDGRILYANPALAHLLGVASVDALAHVDVEKDLGYPRSAFAADIEATGRVRNHVVSWTRRTGDRIHTRENARAVRDAGGTLLYYEGTMEDITAEVEARRDLRDAEACLAAIAEHAPHVLYRLRYTPDGPTFDYLSPAVEALTGYDRAELDARGGISALILERTVIEGLGLSAGPVEDADRYLALYRIETAHGERWIENAAQPWIDPKGRPLGLVGVFQDVTDRKDREERLADEAQTAVVRQRALVDLGHLEGADAYGEPAAAITAATLGVDAVSIWRCTPEGDAVALYSPMPEVATISCKRLSQGLQALGSHRAIAIEDISDAQVDQLGLRPVVEAFQLRSLLVAPMRTRGGADGVVVAHRSQSRPWEVSEVEFFAAAADAMVLAIEQDERERIVEALHISEYRHRMLSEMTSDYAFATSERDGRSTEVRWVAGAAARLDGLGTNAMDSVRAIKALIAPESQDSVRALAAHWRQFGEAEGEFQVRLPNGDRRWVHHKARRGEAAPDGSVVVYHSGRDITIRKRHEAELVDARIAAEAGRAAAERMNRLKSAFLSNMSHEVRTPLTGILGYADLLSEELDGVHAEFVDHIVRSGHRLLDTLSGVLDLARLEAGEVEPASKIVALSPMLQSVLEPYATTAREKGLRFDMELDPAVGAVADPSLLEKVIERIADNAVKFTDSGGVLVTLDASDSAAPDSAAPDSAAGNGADRRQAVIRITDTGDGIDPEFMPHLFEAFRQQDSGHARSHEGSGLGLTLAHRIASLLGGRIEVSSEHPGGTAVSIRLPFAEIQVPDPAPRPQTAPPARRHSPTPANAPSAESPEAHAQAPRLEPPRRLVTPAKAPAPAAPAGVETVAADAPSDRLGDSFDFSFLAGPASASTSPTTRALVVPTSRTLATATPALPTATLPDSPDRPASSDAPRASNTDDMLSFRFSRPGGDDADAGDAPTPAPLPPTTPPPAPASDEPDPVMLIRARTEGPTIPEAGGTEDADVVQASDGRPAILVVEDNDDTRMLLERILRATYAVTAVADARAALQAMNATRFNGLVLDINLGGKETGADILRVARSLPQYKDVFAIALTAYALPGDRERLLESGFSEYVSKPFTRQALMDTLSAGIQA